MGQKPWTEQRKMNECSQQAWQSRKITRGAQDDKFYGHFEASFSSTVDQVRTFTQNPALYSKFKALSLNWTIWFWRQMKKRFKIYMKSDESLLESVAHEWGKEGETQRGARLGGGEDYGDDCKSKLWSPRRTQWQRHGLTQTSGLQCSLVATPRTDTLILHLTCTQHLTFTLYHF